MPFQRLRRVKQLDVADLVYPNASQNRFAHSLGVMFLATRMAEEVLGSKVRAGERVDDAERLRLTGELRIAALLHDIGHYALSHCGENALEKAGGPDKAHEKLGAVLVQSDPLKGIVSRAAQSIGSDYQNIMNYMARTHGGPRYIFQILDSDLDADKMDYLIRDSYHTGVAYGVFDRERLFRMIRCIDDTLVVDEKGTNAVESYLVARYEMYTQVYLHKTVSCFRGIAETIMRKLIGYGLLPSFEKIKKEPGQIADVDDCKFFTLVQEAANGTLRTPEGEQVSDEGLQYLSKCLIWRKRIPLAFYRHVFRAPRLVGLTNHSEDCEEGPEAGLQLEKGDAFESMKKQLRDGEFTDRFARICSHYSLPAETVVIRTKDHVDIGGVSRKIPPKGEEMDERIVMQPQDTSECQGSYGSLIDLIAGASMKVIRVFAPEEVRNEIKKVLEQSWTESGSEE